MVNPKVGTRGLILNLGTNKYPKISIITTVFNNVQFIEEAIISVVNQTYPYIEYIIIDAGSTDGTVDIIKKYEKHISYWISEPDQGIYYGMDKGIQVSSGDYFCILNSDDYYCDNSVIGNIASEITKDWLDFYYSDVYRIERKSKRITKRNYSDINKLHKSCTVPHTGLFISNELYNVLGGYNLSYKIAADYDFTIRMIQQGYKSRYINKVIACTRKGGFSYVFSDYGYESMLVKINNNVSNRSVLYLKYCLNIPITKTKRYILKHLNNMH